MIKTCEIQLLKIVTELMEGDWIFFLSTEKSAGPGCLSMGVLTEREVGFCWADMVVMGVRHG